MWICKNGHAFDEPTEIKADLYEGVQEYDYVCPVCGTDEYEKARLCVRCTKDVPISKMNYDYGDYCVDCIRELWWEKLDGYVKTLPVSDQVLWQEINKTFDIV